MVSNKAFWNDNRKSYYIYNWSFYSGKLLWWFEWKQPLQGMYLNTWTQLVTGKVLRVWSCWKKCVIGNGLWASEDWYTFQLFPLFCACGSGLKLWGSHCSHYVCFPLLFITAIEKETIQQPLVTLLIDTFLVSLIAMLLQNDNNPIYEFKIVL